MTHKHNKALLSDKFSSEHSVNWWLTGSADCALFIWCTWPMLEDWMKVINAWGFKYSGLGWEWIKYNDDTGKFSFGGGYGTRKNLEPCLLAKRGKPDLKSRSVRDFIFEKRREHSRKPDQTYLNIERMYEGPYLELFSRSDRPGWDSWGDEVGRWTAENGETDFSYPKILV